MRFLRRLLHLVRILGSARRNRWDMPRWLARRPLLLASTVSGELALLLQNRVDPRLKTLAEQKAAALVSCEFCLDIGAALAKAEGLTAQQLLDLPRFEESDAYSEVEVLVLRLATGMSQTPAFVPHHVRDALIERLGKAGYCELAFQIAWEHKRSRYYQAIGIEQAGFGDGLACAIPEPAPPARSAIGS